MKKNLSIPIITLTLSATMLVACSNQAEAHPITQDISSSQEVLAAGAGDSSIRIKTASQDPQFSIPVTGDRVEIQDAGMQSVSGNTVTATGYISEADAKQIALNHAGVKEADLIYITVHLDNDHGVIEYEVEFYAGDKEYDYDIDASTGTIRSFDHELEEYHHGTAGKPSQGSSVSNNSINTYIGEAAAQKIALEHAGVKEADLYYLKIKLDREDGVLEYEVEFYAGNTEYDYGIDATTGAIRSFDYDIEDYHYTAPDSNTGSASSQGGISAADAKKIVLAKVPGATEAHIRGFESDMDDGRLIYEGEIRYNGMEYEFEIDAATGTIIDWDVEYDD